VAEPWFGPTGAFSGLGLHRSTSIATGYVSESVPRQTFERLPFVRSSESQFSIPYIFRIKDGMGRKQAEIEGNHAQLPLPLQASRILVIPYTYRGMPP